jgi:hypothetical protein
MPRASRACRCDADDPSETCMVQDFCNAKPLSVFHLKRDIVPPLHGHDPQRRVAWQPTSDSENW